MSLYWNISFVIIGIGFLVKGADWLVEGSIGTALRFHVSALFVGLTIVAFGTSSPELAASLTAAAKGGGDIVMGNIIGSNICNVALILGAASLFNPIHITEQSVRHTIPFMIFCSFLLFFVFMTIGFGRITGIVFIALFVIFNIHSFKNDKKNSSTEEYTEADASFYKLSGLIIIGLVLLGGGANLFLRGAVGIAKEFGISEGIIALTLIAIGTSLPELFLSVVAAYRGNSDIVIGNVIGSNISNILLVVGCTSIICPFEVSHDFMTKGFPFLLVSSISMYPIAKKSRVITKSCGIVFLLCYIVYIVFLASG